MEQHPHELTLKGWIIAGAIAAALFLYFLPRLNTAIRGWEATEQGLVQTFVLVAQCRLPEEHEQVVIIAGAPRHGRAIGQCTYVSSRGAYGVQR